MQVLLANPRGFCAGVDRAISIVERALDIFGPPIYVRHEVVHNRYVVDGLRDCVLVGGHVHLSFHVATHGRLHSQVLVNLVFQDFESLLRRQRKQLLLHLADEQSVLQGARRL